MDKLHYVKVPDNRIVIDYDVKDADGKLTNSLHKTIELPKKVADYCINDIVATEAAWNTIQKEEK